MLEKILVAHDGSDGARRAFEAVELASRLNLKLHMIGVEEPSPPGVAETAWEREEDKANEDSYFARLGDQARSQASLHNIELECNVISGRAVKAITEFVRQGGSDLVVIGYSGHSRIYEHLWGGTSQNLATLAPCSVLVVK